MISKLKLIILLLLAPCSLLLAQSIVPHRDIQPVDSLNRGKPTTAPITVDKEGYSMITRADGKSYWTNLESYIIDSLGLGGVTFDSIVFDPETDTLCFYIVESVFCTPFEVAAGDAVFYDYGTTDTPVV